MKEVTQYIADDGKVFYDYHECADYERQCQSQGNRGFLLLDTNFKSLPLTKQASYEDAVYVFVPDETAIEEATKLFDLWGMWSPVTETSSPGLYRYDQMYGEWENTTIEEQYAELGEILTKLEEVKKKYKIFS